MMPYPALQLVSDGIKRLAVYRDPLTKPADAVIWLHGGNGDAVEFLNGIRPRVDVMDIAPQGLVTGSNPGWTNPWESDIPEEAIDNLIDVRFMASLEAQVRIQFRFVKRVWLCGFSAGGGLVWSVWAMQPVIPQTFSGLCAVGKKLRRTPENAWKWNAAAVPAIPFVMINGANDSPDDESTGSGEHFSWQESYAQARLVNGNTVNEPVVSGYSVCGEPSNLVRLKIASGGKAPAARYVVEGVGHVWQSCESCHTDDLVIERFRAFGLGR
jgi:poly(3-hydroxybutyrate) depolymerase